MANRFYRNLLVWQRARRLAVDVCRATSGPAFRREWGFRDQMRRAAISVPSNVAEGNERGSDRDAARFFFYARGSLAELSTQADVACEIGLLEQTQADEWMYECDELARMLAALIRHRLGS
jgi:four helix bundle protein